MKKIEYCFRIAHIDNISYINETGFVLASSEQASTSYTPIGDPNVIDKRRTNIHGIDLTQYIPFYFGPRSIMLYVIQHGYNGVKKQEPHNIVYCVIRISDLIANNVDCLFTDGHALSAITTFYTHKQLNNINNIISYKDVYAQYWNDEQDIDLKRRKEAELLIKKELDKKHICGYVVYNEKAKETLTAQGIEENRIFIKPNYYF